MTDVPKTSTTMDLADLDVQTPADAGTVVELDHPVTGGPIVDAAGVPWSITVAGDDSRAVRAIDRKHQDRRAERMRKSGDWTMDADSLDAERVERLATATLTWQGLVLNGVVLECTPKAAAKLYADKRFAWISEQVTRAMVDRKRFFHINSPS
jgi:hypothetical protein